MDQFRQRHWEKLEILCACESLGVFSDSQNPGRRPASFLARLVDSLAAGWLFKQHDLIKSVNQHASAKDQIKHRSNLALQSGRTVPSSEHPGRHRTTHRHSGTRRPHSFSRVVSVAVLSKSPSLAFNFERRKERNFIKPAVPASSGIFWLLKTRHLDGHGDSRTRHWAGTHRRKGVIFGNSVIV